MALRVLLLWPQVLLHSPHSPSCRVKLVGKLVWHGCVWHALRSSKQQHQKLKLQP
jgi:hypothetical protein